MDRIPSELLPLLGLLALGAIGLVAAIAVLTVLRATGPSRGAVGRALALGRPTTPEEAGLASTELAVRADDGTILPTWVIKGGGGPEAPDLVLVHGWRRSRVDVLARLGAWHGRARRLVIPDRRGHGDAGGRGRLGVGEAPDLRAVLDAASVERAVLVGWSLGGAVALEAAALEDLRSRIAGVVAMGLPVDLGTALDARLRQVELPAALLGPFVRAGLRIAGAWRPSLERSSNGPDCPVLLVHGVDDAIAPVADVRALAGRWAGVVLHEVAGAAHHEPESADPEGVRAAVDALLARSGGTERA